MKKVKFASVDEPEVVEDNHWKAAMARDLERLGNLTPVPGAVKDVEKFLTPLRGLIREMEFDRAQGRTGTSIAHDKWLPLIRAAMDGVVKVKRQPQSAALNLINEEIDAAIMSDNNERFVLLTKIRDALNNRLT